jgi:hypothetical protein
MLGLYLLDADRIHRGEKHAIANATPHTDLPGYKALVGKLPDGHAALLGIALIGDPLLVNDAAFDAAEPLHGVARKDRLRWWPTVDTLYLYPISTYWPLAVPQAVDLRPGTTMLFDDYEIQARITGAEKSAGQYRYTIGVSINPKGVRHGPVEAWNPAG